jgi:hypothetical protein
MGFEHCFLLTIERWSPVDGLQGVLSVLMVVMKKEEDPMINHHPRHVVEVYEMLTVFRLVGPNVCPV